jgi:hypothetical protein
MGLARNLSKFKPSVDGLVEANDIAEGAVGSDALAATAVTAGTYGTASAIPAITVDADGRITGVTTNAVSGGVTSLNGQTGAITDTSYGAIGSYFLGSYTGNENTPLAANGTVAGSTLIRALELTIRIGDFSTNYESAGLTGTYRNMAGNISDGVSQGGSGYRINGLFVRIS